MNEDRRPVPLSLECVQGSNAVPDREGTRTLCKCEACERLRGTIGFRATRFREAPEWTAGLADELRSWFGTLRDAEIIAAWCALVEDVPTKPVGGEARIVQIHGAIVTQVLEATTRAFGLCCE